MGKRLFLIPTIYFNSTEFFTYESELRFLDFKMLYFWLTSAVHQANRASMESLELSLTKRKYKGKGKKSRKKYQSESDLSNNSTAANDQQCSEQSLPTIRKASMTTASNSSLSSVV